MSLAIGAEPLQGWC